MLQCCLLTNICSKLAFSQLPVEDDIDLSDVDLDDIWDKDELWDLQESSFLGRVCAAVCNLVHVQMDFPVAFLWRNSTRQLCCLMHCSSELYATQENIAEILWIVITSELDCILCNEYFEDNIDFGFFFSLKHLGFYSVDCAVWVLQKAVSVTNFKCVFFFFLFCGGGTWSASVSIK